MNVPRCTPTLGAALRRTFSTAREAPPPPRALHTQPSALPTVRSRPSSAPPRLHLHLPVRAFTTTSPSQRKYKRAYKPTPAPTPNAAGGGARPGRGAKGGDGPYGGAPTNEAITAPTILIASDGQGLAGPYPTSAVLAKLDASTHVLRVVSPGSGGVPICRVFELAAEEDLREARAERERARTKATTATRPKIVEINWAIAENDLALKMRRMREFLAAGFRVEVVMLVKKRGRKGTPEECARVMEAVRGVVGEVEGARDAKPPEGEVGRTMRMYVEVPTAG